jgi:hypothetical protein
VAAGEAAERADARAVEAREAVLTAAVARAGVKARVDAEMTLAEKVRLLRTELELDASLPMVEVVRQANAEMQLQPVGALNQQADALIRTLGINQELRGPAGMGRGKERDTCLVS